MRVSSHMGTCLGKVILCVVTNVRLEFKGKCEYLFSNLVIRISESI